MYICGVCYVYHYQSGPVKLSTRPVTPVKFICKVDEYYCQILLLKALREEDFGHELQQMSSFFSSDLDKFKLEIQLKNLIHIVD